MSLASSTHSLPLKRNTYAAPDPVASKPSAALAPTRIVSPSMATARPNQSSESMSDEMSVASSIHCVPSKRYTRTAPESKPPCSVSCRLAPITAMSPLMATAPPKSSQASASDMVTLASSLAVHWPLAAGDRTAMAMMIGPANRNTPWEHPGD